jgi:pimeloyl-ACP methyl ester carboxylesterase
MGKSMTGYAELEDGKLYYELAGEGDTLILGHAGFVDSRMWDAQWDALTQHYRVLRMDMRGYGKSDPAHGPRNRRADLLHLLNHLHIERAALLGCSMGGTIVLDFALEHPEMVSALITVSSAPSGFQPQGSPPPLVMEMVTAAQQGELARVSELQLCLWVDGPYRQPEQVNPLVRERAAIMNRIPVGLNTWGVADAHPLHPLDPPAIGRLGAIHTPALIMAGALDDPEILRATDVMTEGIEGAKKQIFTHSAHVPNMEEPETFTQVGLGFLAGLTNQPSIA